MPDNNNNNNNNNKPFIIKLSIATCYTVDSHKIDSQYKNYTNKAIHSPV